MSVYSLTRLDESILKILNISSSSFNEIKILLEDSLQGYSNIHKSTLSEALKKLAKKGYINKNNCIHIDSHRFKSKYMFSITSEGIELVDDFDLLNQCLSYAFKQYAQIKT